MVCESGARNALAPLYRLRSAISHLRLI